MDSKVSVSAFNKPKKKVRWPVSGNSNPKSYGTIPDHNDSSSDESDYHPRDTIVPRNKKLYGEVEFHGAGHKTRAKVSFAHASYNYLKILKISIPVLKLR